MSWQILTAISVITLSLSVLLQRLLLHHDKSNPYAYVVVFQGLVAVLIGIYAVINGFQAPDFSKYWFPMLATVLLYSTGHIVYAKTLQKVEASIFSILFATNAIWAMVIGLFVFDESITLKNLAGVLLIFLSVGVLTEHKKKLKVDLGIALGLLTGFLFGLATIAWVYVGKYADAASWTSLSFAGPSLVVLLTNISAAKDIRSFLSGKKLIRMVLLGIFFSISAVTLLIAFQKGSVSLIAPLQQTTIILTMLLGVFFLKEKSHILRKILSAFLCFVGVLLIV